MLILLYTYSILKQILWYSLYTTGNRLNVSPNGKTMLFIPYIIRQQNLAAKYKNCHTHTRAPGHQATSRGLGNIQTVYLVKPCVLVFWWQEKLNIHQRIV